jgi:murein DD-endopeptidase MepM/ murein hydrolase activator NlpD
MQLMWISDSTGEIKKISITFKTILIVLAVAAFFFVAMGSVMNLIGFRVAIEQRPEMVRAMGGVITAQQQQEIEDLYREKLATLETRIRDMSGEITELIKTKNKFADLATPKIMRRQSPVPVEGSGGPFLPMSDQNSINKDNFFEVLDSSIKSAASFKRQIAQMNKRWNEEFVVLNDLPTSAPIDNGYRLSSGFGARIDPFTEGVAFHAGLDFAAPIGTLVLSTGNGIVVRVGQHHDYGNFVEVRHKGGYKTRYAHNSEILVKPNQVVTRYQPIARVGSTGRSTGPHLHYEVIKDGGFFGSDTKLDPMVMLANI